MATEKIDGYIDRVSFKSDTSFAIDELQSVYDALTKLSKVKYSPSFQGGSTKETAKAINALNAELAKTAQLTKQVGAAFNQSANSQKAETAAAKENTKAKKEQAAAEKAAAKEQKDRVKAAKEAEVQARRDAKILDELSNDYTQLSKAYSEAALKAKNYALTLGESHPTTVQAVADAKGMADILKRVDASVGQFGRNVGNYADGFSGLRTSFNQVSRELPALAINTQTFLLAISNNLPMLADEIGNAKGKIKELQEAGKPAPSLFQAIGGAIFSWQTALSLGVTALTVFGPKLIDWVDGLISGRNATEAAAEELDIYTKAIDAATDATENFKAVTKVDFGTMLRGLQNQLAYAQALGKSDKETLAIRKKIAELEQKEAGKDFFQTGGRDELDKLSAAFETATDQYKAFQLQRPTLNNPNEESIVRLEQRLKTQMDSTQKAYERQDAVVKRFYNANRDLNIINLELERASGEEIVKLRAKEFDTAPLEYYKDKLLQASGAELTQLESRKNFRKEAFDVEKLIIQKQYENEIEAAKVAQQNVIRDKKSSQADLINAQLDYNEAVSKATATRDLEQQKAEDKLGYDLISIKGAYLKELAAMDREATEEFEKETKERRENAIKIEEDRLSAKTNKDDENLARELTKLDTQYMEGKIKKDEYEKTKLTLENKYRELSLRAELQYVKNLLAIRAAAGFDVGEQLKQIAQIEQAINALSLKNFEDSTKRKSDLLKQLSVELKNLFATIVNASFENQKNAIQDQIDLLDKKKQKEIEAINATTASEEEKANKIAILNARAAAQKEQLEVKQRQIQQRQAQFQKKLSIAEIIARTAEAVIAALGAKPYTPANIGMAAIVGAIGAAQLATVIATPIPRYAEGIFGDESHPGGLAMLNDGGKPEVVVEPGKAPYLASGTNVITTLPKGTRVYPDAETFARLNHPVISLQSDTVDSGLMENLMKDHIRATKQLGDIIKNKREYHPDGRVKDGPNWTRYINQNIKY